MLIFFIKFIWWIYTAIEYDQYKSYFCSVMIVSFWCINETDIFFKLFENIVEILIAFCECLIFKNIFNVKDGETT